MQEKVGTGRGLFYMALLMTLLLGIRHAELLQAPNAYFIGDSVDGFRSMSANVYHIRHDSTYQHFMGMNYPYGDEPGYADTFPFLSNAVKYFHENDATWFPMIWNLSLVFSQLLCGLFLFLVFRALNLPVWYSILAALGVSTLTPQLDRFAAHYCLSFAFLLPMTMWLLIHFGRKPKLYLSLLIALVPIIANAIHPYHMAMVVFLIAGYFFFRFLHQPSLKNLGWLISHATIQLVIPLGYLLVTTVLIDSIDDRPGLPWGFTFYTTRWESLLLPIDLPLGRIIDREIQDIDYVLAETRAYLGGVVILGGCFLLLRGLYQLLRRNTSSGNLKSDPTIKYLLWSSIIILLYAACFPFKVFGGEWMTDYLGLLRQFRVLGRFAWVFFYVSNVAVLYYLFLVIQKINSETLRKVVYGLVFSVLLIEGIGYIFWEKYELIPRPETRAEFSQDDNPWTFSVPVEEYQAILPIPFFHIGSENFWYAPLGKHLHRTLWAGADHGLPVMGSFLGRTSISQTIKLIEAVAEPYRRPAILDDFPNDKPILVFVTKDAYNHLGYRYRHVTRGLKQLYEDEFIILYELPLSTWEERVEKQSQQYRTEVDSSIIIPHGEIFSKDSLLNFVYKSYDDLDTTIAYQGGAKAFAAKEDHVVFDDTIPNQQNQERTVLSLWSKMDIDLTPRTRMTITEYLPESGEVLQTVGGGFHEYIRSVDEGWMLIDYPFELKQTDSKVKVILRNSDMLYGTYFYVDELQIRNASTRLYQKNENWRMVNNRWIPVK